MTFRRALAVAGLALALALVAGRLVAGAYAEWAWYDALGAASLWRVRFASLALLRGGLFIIAFSFAFANLLAMRRSIVSLVLPRRLANLEIGEAVPGAALTVTAAILSAIIAAAVTLPQNDWVAYLRARWAAPVGESDPYLNRDLAFWMGWMPFERNMHEWAVLLAVVVGIAVVILYALTPSVHVEHGRVHVSTWVRRHFAMYTAVLLLLVAWGYRLDAYDLFIRGSGVRESFSAFDHRVLFPYLVAISFGTAAAGIVVAWTGWIGHQRAMLGALLVVLVAGPLGRMGLPLVDRRAVGERERASLERPYTHTRLLYTRRAYRVDDIARGDSADSVRIAASDVASRVSSWDPAALALAAADDPKLMVAGGATAWRVTSADSLRAVVSYGSEGVDPSRGETLLEELDPSDADERGGPWPAVPSTVASLPAIAVGVGALPARVIEDTLGRIEAPAFASTWSRIGLAWGVRSLRLAFRDDDPRYARLLTRRDVRTRVRALAPFFTVGATPQSFIARDSLWWQLELFNASSDHPLSEPIVMGGQTMHFAATAGFAVVNAHSGRVMLVLATRPDKMTRWWRDHLPDLFVTRAALGDDLLRALPPPVDRAVVQGSALARTGFRNDTLSARPLFQADDADVELLPGAPTPFVSGATGNPLAWGVPAVDAMDRLRGVFVAIGGWDARTALVELPDTLRWSAVLDQLQRTADSARISRTRRHPRRGRVQVVPTTGGLLALQSYYEWIPDRAPVLAGTVTWQRGETRAAASLATSYGGVAQIPASDARLRLRLARVYEALQDALRRADWAAFGRAMAELRRLSSDH